MWWKEGIMYQIYPRSFKDTTGDGIGDLNGITEKLDYLQDLGIDILWMSPIFKSPNADNGYDISDYRDIMTEFGTMADFDRLLAEAHKRKIKVLLDIVLNHTSDHHPWFVESRLSTDNPKRDYYFWKESINNWSSIFQGSAWEHDDHTDEYYLHYFLKEQPDLNWENEEVRNELIGALRFWLDKGVDGFRLDVIPFISKRTDFKDTPHDDMYDTMSKIYANGPRLHEYLNLLYESVWKGYDCFTVGEGVGISREEAPLYVASDRHELHTIYHFDHFNLDQGPGGKLDVKPIDYASFKQIFMDWDALVDQGCWNIIYLGNHDLGRMTSRIGSKLFTVASAKLLNTVILTLRGTPIIYMGDELGMTNATYTDIEQIDDVESRNAYVTLVDEGDMSKEAFMKATNITGREHARTPFPWTGLEHGGFTEGMDPWITLNPNYKIINAVIQKDEPSSVYEHCKKVISLRKENESLSIGDCRFISVDSDHVFAYTRQSNNDRVLIVHNLNDFKSVFYLDELSFGEVLVNNYSDLDNDNNKIGLEPWQSIIVELN